MQVGGFLPFSFDATDCLVEGRNEIEVRVDSPIEVQYLRHGGILQMVLRQMMHQHA